jgi:hypothetical protein
MSHSISRTSSAARHLALASLLLFVAACGDEDQHPLAPTPAPSLNALLNGTAVPIALIHDANHNIVSNQAIPDATGIHGRVVVNGSGPVPTGTVTFRWYFNSECSTIPTMVMTAPLTGTDPVESAPSFGAKGVVALQVEYSGDVNYPGSKSLCTMTNASGKAIPTIGTWLHNAAHQVLSEMPANTDLHPIANVTGKAGTPTGTVGFYRHSVDGCSGVPEHDQKSYVLAFGVADGVSTVRPYFAGTYAVQAFYNGDNTYAAFVGPCVVFTAVDKAVPTIVVDIHNDAHQVVTSVGAWVLTHGKAVVSGSGPTPTGVVGFRRYTNATCSGDVAGVSETLDASGIADGGTGGLTMPSGTGSIRAVYSGDANYVTGMSNCVTVEFVGGPLPTVTTTEIHNGQHESITSATISVSTHAKAAVTVPNVGPTAPTPTGTVVFYKFANATCFGAPIASIPPLALNAAAINDEGVFMTDFGAGQTYSVQAEYSGDQNYLGSVGSCVPFTRVAGLVPTIATEVHTDAHEAVTAVFPTTMVHTRTVVSGAGPDVWGAIRIEHFTNGTCSGDPSTTLPLITTIKGVVDASSFQAGAPPLGQTWAYRVKFLGDENYDPAVGPCAPYTTVLQTAGITLGSIGYWRNWRNQYSSSQLQQLIDYLKANAAPVFNKDQVAGTADDLTAAKLDAIYLFPKKLTATQQVLAHFTSLSLDLALTQLASAGLTQPNGAICSAGTIDVSLIPGAAALLGTSSPTVGQVTTFVAQKWTGTLTTNRANWSFDLTSSQLDTLLAVLGRINDGSIVITTGC